MNTLVGILIAVLITVLWKLETISRDLNDLRNEPQAERETRIRCARKWAALQGK